MVCLICRKNPALAPIFHDSQDRYGKTACHARLHDMTLVLLALVL